MTQILSVLQTIFWGLLVLSVLVYIHEGGHYLAARLFGVRVTEFFLGMPCRLRLAHRSRKHGTLVGVTPILLGGYTKICGMEGEEDPRLADVFACVCRHGRVEVSQLAAEVGCETEEAYELLATLADWASVEPYYDPERDEYENQSDWPAQFQTVARDTHGLTCYDSACTLEASGGSRAGEPFDTGASAADALASERAHTYLGCGFLKRVCMLVAGPLFNFILAMLVITVVYSCLGVQALPSYALLADVDDGSFAAQAGLRAGDIITSVDGEDVSSVDEAYDLIVGSDPTDGQEFQITYERDGTEHTTSASWSSDYDRLGVTVGTIRRYFDPLTALNLAFAYSGQVIGFVVQLIVPTHTLEVLNSSTSVVGISVATSQAASMGIDSLLMIVASISMSLCFVNLLPIPPLDGGKVLIELIQFVRGRPLPKRAQMIVSYVGLAFFLFVFIYVLRLDLLRYIF